MADRQAHEVIEQILQLEAAGLTGVGALDLADQVAEVAYCCWRTGPAGLSSFMRSASRFCLRRYSNCLSSCCLT